MEFATLRSRADFAISKRVSNAIPHFDRLDTDMLEAHVGRILGPMQVHLRLLGAMIVRENGRKCRIVEQLEMMASVAGRHIDVPHMTNTLPRIELAYAIIEWLQDANFQRRMTHDGAEESVMVVIADATVALKTWARLVDRIGDLQEMFLQKKPTPRKYV